MTKESKVKIGDRFGKLVVVDEHDGIQIRNGKLSKAWLCKCDCGNVVPMKESLLLKEISTMRSCGECKPEKNPNYTPKGMSFEDKQDWDELYNYVRKNILGYDSNQSLSNSMVARLQGLLHGKYMANNKTANNANYSFKTVLNTFKFCYLDIQKALRNINFKDENHKFNYITKIVEQSINTVYVKEKQAERAKEEAKKTNVGLEDYKEAEYKPKKNKKDRFNDLW